MASIVPTNPTASTTAATVPLGPTGPTGATGVMAAPGTLGYTGTAPATLTGYGGATGDNATQVQISPDILNSMSQYQNAAYQNQTAVLDPHTQQQTDRKSVV